MLPIAEFLQPGKHVAEANPARSDKALDICACFRDRMGFLLQGAL